MQAEHQVTVTRPRHHVYGLVLCPWKSFVCEEQIKRRISLRIQFPNCVLYLGLELCFLYIFHSDRDWLVPLAHVYS